jgi:hypothetical protein
MKGGRRRDRTRDSDLPVGLGRTNEGCRLGRMTDGPRLWAFCVAARRIRRPGSYSRISSPSNVKPVSACDMFVCRIVPSVAYQSLLSA